MIYLISALALVLSFTLGVPVGIQWQQGRDAERKVADMLASKVDTAKWQKAIDTKTLPYLARQSANETELQNARLQIANLSRTRACLGGATVRMLNTIDLPRPAPAASALASPSPAVASDSAGRSASVAATADAVALCRAGHKQLAAQLNEILDFEDTRDAQGK